MIAAAQIIQTLIPIISQSDPDLNLIDAHLTTLLKPHCVPVPHPAPARIRDTDPTSSKYNPGLYAPLPITSKPNDLTNILKIINLQPNLYIHHYDLEHAFLPPSTFKVDAYVVHITNSKTSATHTGTARNFALAHARAFVKAMVGA